MAGHSHWKQIKIKKAVTDKKKGKEFSKLLAAISIAAKSEPNPEFNPRLRTAVNKAKEVQIPQENIERAIQKSKDSSQSLEEITAECYGPGGIAILIEAITDNSNRTINEIKLVLKDFDGKLGEPGSVKWAFNKKIDGGWESKFPQEISQEDGERVQDIIDKLNDLNDVQNVYTNAKS